MSASKVCTQCREEKPLSEFCKDGRRKDGRGSKCKPCVRDINRAWEGRNEESRLQKRRAWREANRDHLAQYHAKYREEHLDEITARQSQYRRENAERIRELGEALRAKHGAKWNSRIRDYRRANPHVPWLNSYRQRATRFGHPLVVEDFTKPDVIDRYGDACFYCGGAFEHLDHYVPISKGGPHTLDNVRPSCAACNLAKFQQVPADATAAHDRWEDR